MPKPTLRQKAEKWDSDYFDRTQEVASGYHAYLAGYRAAKRKKTRVLVNHGEPTTLHCANCETELTDGWKHCPGCGLKIDWRSSR